MCQAQIVKVGIKFFENVMIIAFYRAVKDTLQEKLGDWAIESQS